MIRAAIQTVNCFQLNPFSPDMIKYSLFYDFKIFA